MSPEFDRRRRARAMVTGLLLGALVILFYLIAIVRIGHGA